MTFDKATIAENLRRLLAERGWTPYTLAKELGCERRANTIYRIVRGDNAPSLQTLGRFADAMGVPVENFLAPTKKPRN